MALLQILPLLLLRVVLIKVSTIITLGLLGIALGSAVTVPERLFAWQICAAARARCIIIVGVDVMPLELGTVAFAASLLCS